MALQARNCIPEEISNWLEKGIGLVINNLELSYFKKEPKT